MNQELNSKPFQSWVRVSLLGGFFFAGLSILLIYNFDSLLEWGRSFYVLNDRWRFPHFRERVLGNIRFLPVLSACCFFWAGALWAQSKYKFPSVLIPSILRSRPAVWSYGIAGAVLLLGLSFYYSQSDWIRFNRPCWDGYCDYARLVHNWLFSKNEQAAAALRSFMGSDYHANSPGGPVIVAFIMKLTGWSSMTAYRFASGAATIATMIVVWLTLRGLSLSRTASLASVVLLWTNIAVVRSSIFPQTDALAMLWAALFIFVALKQLADPSSKTKSALMVLLVTGLFIKLSLLPMMGLPVAWFLIDRQIKSGQHPRWMSIQDLLAFLLVPLIAYLLFQVQAGTATHYRVEFNMMPQRDSWIVFVALSFFTTCGIFLFLALISRSRWTETDAYLIGWIALYLASLWLSRASGWNRFYLPILPVFALVGAKGLEKIKREAGSGMMWAFVLGGAFLGYLGMALQIYY